MAIGGIVPNFTTALSIISGSFYAGLLPAVLLGLTAEDPDARKYLISKLKTSGPYNATSFLASLKFDFATGIVLYRFQDIFNYFVDGEVDVLAPIIQKILDTNGYQGYHGIPQMPVFTYKAIHDELAPIQDADALVTRWCSVGVQILYQRNTVGSHIDEYYNRDARSFEWLTSVLGGIYSTRFSVQGCTI